MNNYNKSRCYAIARRWLILVVLAFTALLIFSLLFPAYHYSIEKAIIYLDRFPNIIKIGIALSLVFMLFLFIYWMGGIRKRDFYSVELWPPIWKWAIIITLIYIFFIDEFLNSYQFIPSKREWTILTILVLLTLINWPVAIIYSIMTKIYSKRLSPNAPEQQQIDKLENFNDVIEWLEVEKPINMPEEDRFNMAVIARRIARILCEKPLKSIGIIGPYGCGKSSILNMVEYYIDNLPKDNTKRLFDPEKIVICKIDGWGLRVESSAEIILKQTVAKLSKYVDCLSLINIPNGYQDALSNAGPWWMKFISSGLNRKDALLQLKRLDNVLLCAGLRMLIFLEDLDRNLQKDEKLSEIAALLDRLKELENVSFVLAINRNVNLAESGIILRIAEHIEVIPELPRKDIRSIFEMFCENCRTLYTEDIVFLSEKYRSERWGPVNYPDSLHEATGGFDKPVFSIPKLLTGPRLLKQSLRRTWQAWQNLHGETDFDDLLIVNVLRFAAPEAYDFIHDYIHQLRIAENGKFKDIVKDRTHAALSGMSGEDKPDNDQDIIILFNNYVKEVTWNKKAAYNLLEILFPGVSSWGSNETLGPQCIGRKYNSADYWNRLNSEELDETELKDQLILQMVDGWRQNKEAKVFQEYTLAGAMLYNEEVAEKIEDFDIILNDDEIKTLSEQLFALILQGHGKRKNPIGSHDDYPGFIELWRLAQHKSIKNYDDWIFQEIKKALPVNLRFANDLFYYWSTDRLIHERDKLRNNLILESKNIYRNSESLLKAIDPDYVFCVYHFVVLYSEPEYGGSGYNPEDWIWLADILLDAGHKNPDIIIPQIVCLVFQRNMGKKEYIYKFEDENAKKLFGQRYSELMKLLSNEINAPNLREEDKEFIKFAHQQAKAWIAEHDNDNKK